MPHAAKLKEWAQEYHAHPLLPAYEKTVVEADIAPVALRSDNQLLYVNEVSPQQGQSYLVTNNHFVLQIFTLSSEEAHLERFRTVVNSLAFVVDAPANLAELYDPDPAPWITTLEEWYEYEREQMEVSRAFDIRAQTGETPTEILEGLSEAARQDYERAIESNAAYLEELDRQRALNGGEWQPPPEPTTDTGIPDHCR